MEKDFVVEDNAVVLSKVTLMHFLKATQSSGGDEMHQRLKLCMERYGLVS